MIGKPLEAGPFPLPRHFLPSPVWLDGRNIGSRGGTGVARYTRDLADCLHEIGVSTAFLDGRDENPGKLSFRELEKAYRLVRALRSQRHIIDRPDTQGHTAPSCIDLYRTAHVRYKTFGRLTSLRADTPPALMHWTYPLPMVLQGCMNIVTIHDLVPILNPGLTGIDPGRFERLLRELVTRMDRIVTVSETVRRQIIDILDVAPERVVNLYQMVDIDITAVMASPRIVPPGSLIHIGRVESRKNIARLVAAYARSRSHRPLVLVGPDGDDRPDLSLPDGPGRLIRLPWSSRLQLLRGLAEAHALVFPSLAEGFGLPIIEAMALGTPVITSRGGATEEIAGGAARLVDPFDVDDIAGAISELDGVDKTCGVCGELVRRGYVRAKFFSRQAYTARLAAFHARLTA